MATLPESQGGVRVTIFAAPQGVPWHIQLNQPAPALIRGTTYTVSFRARGAAPRTISVGVSQAHAPWGSLGLYNNVAVDTVWQPFSMEFVAVESDDLARLHFDLGVSAESVDLADVALRARQ